ncbi:MAG: hydroxymethylbilane synthase [Candidatus Acididesulfobacter guangdongensis]|uniref:Porphobilinogen deaminase n=1 Tax=Acididesulfobacter guangdongensis TaxID=2597225 RepID=A0A519BIL1_ACIG2|nr:MAG: hydroxymethylbilane synthase [Candidatus Acididesulfobacter guangdongensis]
MLSNNTRKYILKLGTRGSKLALYQANTVKDQLLNVFKGQNIDAGVEIIPIKTSGDKITHASLSSFGGKGLFVKEIEEALLAGKIDIAVHSLKDVPQVIPDELIIGCTLKRDDPRDCLILKDGTDGTEYTADVKIGTDNNTISEKNAAACAAAIGLLKRNAVVGTSSLRRRILMQRLRDDLIFEPLRGNIDTRIQKVKDGVFDAIILSSSGLIRLGLDPLIDFYLDPLVFIPQCGQGVIAIEFSKNNKELAEVLQFINDGYTFVSTYAERDFIRILDCGCASPVGVYSYLSDDDISGESKIYIKGFVSNMNGEYLEADISGSKTEYKELGKKLAHNIVEKGGLEILSKNK